ncbi:hypothetical protein AGABI1DRAFT_134119 [Agaricus bisporus var. burnettii JB137-S8]|uniref:Uncharacterized protein n=1 Tax=Agaricus bisporus var. burnettii (strain JB137-S8 / ATCC MYA-4627 / FGSC 10392) TaxID=597362 RepID=K5WT83_AGABU|nr:uncharacterized protein AGABI1DRAFT_134119 [Agaricus bisporus var. burnettii JB137-S8]EKM73772.1 hypothetical protein AGABI1DRAFT_134119 [Agaricus bisporus var. burnettii JB137-S8]
MSSVSRSRLSSVAPGSRGLSVAPGSRGLSVAPGSRGSSVFSTRTSYRASPPFPTQVSRTSPAIPALDVSGSGSGIPSRASSIMPIHSSSNMTSRTSSAVPSRSHAPPPISRPGPSTGSSSTVPLKRYTLLQLSGLARPPGLSKPATLTSQYPQTLHAPLSQASTSVPHNVPVSKGHHGQVSHSERVSSRKAHQRR